MMPIILLVGLLAAAFYHFKIKPMPAGERKKMLWRLALWALIGLLVLGVASGRLHWLGGVLAGALALLRNSLFAGLAVGRFWLARSGGIARFNTEYIAAELDVNRLVLSGRILKGPYANLTLEELSKAQLEELLEFYASRDKKSFYLIKTLQQRRGFESEPHSHIDVATAPNIQEAMEILGLQGEPERDAVLKAHRTLIHKLHPDRGGSDYLAGQVNAARDQLINYLDNKNR